MSNSYRRHWAPSHSLLQGGTEIWQVLPTKSTHISLLNYHWDYEALNSERFGKRSEPITRSISSCAFFWIDGSLTMASMKCWTSAMVVSAPAISMNVVRGVKYRRAWHRAYTKSRLIAAAIRCPSWNRLLICQRRRKGERVPVPVHVVKYWYQHKSTYLISKGKATHLSLLDGLEWCLIHAS